jgi:CRP-like cAMP-binding protein
VESRIELLKNIPLFRTLTLEYLYNISSKVQEVEYDSDEVVIHINDEGDALYIIQSGSVQVLEPADFQKNEIVLADLKCGDYFGEMALLTEEKRSATIRTSSPSTLLRLSKGDFQKLIDSNPSLYIPIAYVLSQRLKEGNVKRKSELLSYNQKYTPSGSLTDRSVIDILKYCEENALNGLVKIRHKDDLGILEYERGTISSIELNELIDDQAIDQMLKWQEGKFIIEPRVFSFEMEPIESHEENDNVVYTFTRKDLAAVINLIVISAIKLIGTTIIKNFLNRFYLEIEKTNPEIKIFQVNTDVKVEIKNSIENKTITDEELFAAVIWLKKLIKESAKYEIKFDHFDVKHLTHAYYSILKNVGFYDYYYTTDEL